MKIKVNGRGDCRETADRKAGTAQVYADSNHANGTCQRNRGKLQRKKALHCNGGLWKLYDG